MLKAIIIIPLFGLLMNSAIADRGQFREMMINACEGKSAGDACSFEGRRGQVSGTCLEGKKDSSVLTCKNANPRKNKRARKSN